MEKSNVKIRSKTSWPRQEPYAIGVCLCVMGEVGDSWVTKPLTHSSLLIVAFARSLLLKLLMGHKRHPGLVWASAVTLLTFPTLDSSLGLEWEEPQRDLDGLGRPCTVGWATGASAVCRGHRGQVMRSLWRQTPSTAPRGLSLGMLEAWGSQRARGCGWTRESWEGQRHCPMLWPASLHTMRSGSSASVHHPESASCLLSCRIPCYLIWVRPEPSLSHTPTPALPISLDFTWHLCFTPSISFPPVSGLFAPTHLAPWHGLPSRQLFCFQPDAWVPKGQRETQFWFRLSRWEYRS